MLDDRGPIMPGKRADLILVDGDPTPDISAIRKVAMVLTRGVAISPGHAELGVKPFVASEPTVVSLRPEPRGLEARRR